MPGWHGRNLVASMVPSWHSSKAKVNSWSFWVLASAIGPSLWECFFSQNFHMFSYFNFVPFIDQVELTTLWQYVRLCCDLF